LQKRKEKFDLHTLLIMLYEGRSISSTTVLLIKHQANTEYRKYSEGLPPLMYTTYGGFINDVTQYVIIIQM